MDPMRGWMHAGILQKMCFFFLFGVVTVTVVRTIRLTLHGEGRRERAKPLVASTYGLAQAGLWFTSASAALGVISPGTFGHSTIAIMAQGLLDVFDLTAVGLGLCALNFIAGAVFEAMAAEGPPLRWRLARRAIGIIAILLLAAALSEMRTTYVAEMHGRGDRWVGNAAFRAAGTFTFRLAALCSGCGFVTWLCVLADRRRVGSWESEVGS